jgi:competence protein CoiA
MRQRQEAAKREREARKKEQEAAAARRRKELEEAARARRAEEERERRKEWEEQHRKRMEELRRLRAEQEAARAREEAERLERERRARETAEAWWERLSQPQVEELFSNVVNEAWQQERLRVQARERACATASFAYGIPVYSQGRYSALYGIVRPCPELVALAPQLSFQRVFVRNAQEADALIQQGLAATRITRFNLPEHEQLPLC